MGLLQTKAALLGKKTTELAQLPRMKDPGSLALMRIFFFIGTAAYVAAPELVPLIVFQLVRLSVKYGNAPQSAFGYAAYGFILCGVLTDIQAGSQFGQLAFEVLRSPEARKLAARTNFLVNCFITHWHQPLQSTLQPFLQNYQKSLETGDVEFAAWSIQTYSYYAFYAGKELEVLEQEMVTYGETIAQFKQTPILNLHRIYQQTALNLRNTDQQDPTYLQGEIYNEKISLPLHYQQDEKSPIAHLHVNKLFLCYVFGQYEAGLDNAAIAQEYLDGVIGLITIPSFYFYDSLTRLALAKSNLPLRNVLSIVNANQKKMRKWADHGPENFSHKFYLVEAEKYRVLRYKEKAGDYYDRAIDLAQEHGFLQEEAIANELAAKFYLSLNKTKLAQPYLRDSHYCYLRWGATAKVEQLERDYPQLLSVSKPELKNTTITTLNTLSNFSHELDLATVMKACQAITSDIVLDKLLANLIKILIENAGAQIGYLLLPAQEFRDGEVGQLLIEAEGQVDTDEVTVLQSVPLNSKKNNHLLAVNLINYVARTKESVVLHDATREGKFTQDPYIKKYQPQSILCTPLINQGKLVSIVYLENNLTTGAFTSNRLEIIRLLCSQAAISLENARLYASQEEYARTLEYKVKERTAELEKANDELQRIATLDGLTKVANRRRFDEYLSQEWQRMTREQQSLSLILCDVDYFKLYNDKYGHQAGDDCLVKVAQAIRRSAKGPRDLVARYGGEEFAIILPQTNSQGAIKVAETIRQEVKKLQITHQASLVDQHVTLSLGICCTIPQPNYLVETIIACADQGLYGAKKQGRDRSILQAFHLQEG